MKFEVDEIICPYCGHSKDPENELDEGPFMIEDYACESCDNYFALEADVYSVSYSFASWTIEEYEDRLKKEEERLKRARAEMEKYWKEMEDSE